MGCENAAWAGDGYCDDSTNTAECNFDNGDCCGGNVNMQYSKKLGVQPKKT